MPPRLFAPSRLCGVIQPATYCTACSFNGRAFRSIVSWLACPFFQSRADGVAQPAMWLSVAFFGAMDSSPRRSASVFVGVAQPATVCKFGENFGFSDAPVWLPARGDGQPERYAASSKRLL